MPETMPANHVKRAYAPIGKTYPLIFPDLKPSIPINKRGWKQISPFFQAFLSRCRKLSRDNFFPCAIPPYGFLKTFISGKEPEEGIMKAPGFTNR